MAGMAATRGGRSLGDVMVKQGSKYVHAGSGGEIHMLTFDFSETLAYICSSVGAHYATTLASADKTTLLSALETPERVASLDAAFRKAYKTVDGEYPNFGSRAGLDHDGWWRMVVEQTFEGALGGGGEEEESLYGRAMELLEEGGEVYPQLVDHFTSDRAYAVYPDVRPALQELGAQDGLVVGIVTNMTAKVNSTLASLQLDGFADFVVDSHSVGVTKPHPDIFAAALRAGSDAHALDLVGMVEENPDQVVALHVGDSYPFDYVGAQSAPGFAGLLLSRSDARSPPPASVDRGDIVHSLDL